MKEAGISGVYHICRLGEGEVTNLKPEARRQTFQNAIDVGLDVLNAVEPIGPEHTPEQLAEQIMIMKSQNPIQTGVNPRDTAADTSAGRGMDLTDCRMMLFEAGFTKLAKGDGTLIGLDMDYIKAHIH